MNWYKKSKLNKQTSLSFNVEEPQGTFRTLFNITSELNRLLWNMWTDKLDHGYYKEFGTVPGSETITIDGTDVDSPTGTINFYVDGINPEKVSLFLNNILNFLQQNRIQTGEIYKDTSKMYSVPVIRIPVISNPYTTKDFPPEITLANNNAFFLFNNILKYNKDLWEDNVFDPIELKKRIEYFEGETQLEEGAFDDTKFYNGKTLEEYLNSDELKEFLSGRKAISNYNENEVRNKLKIIKDYCVWAINHGYKTIFLA